MNTEINELLTQIKQLDWSVDEEGDHLYRFGKYSPAGQDFSISVEGETVEEIIAGIKEAHERYDVSEETYLWLDDSGHGRNGAPSALKDVLADMEACEQLILDLYDELVPKDIKPMDKERKTELVDQRIFKTLRELHDEFNGAIQFDSETSYSAGTIRIKIK